MALALSKRPELRARRSIYWTVDNEATRIGRCESCHRIDRALFGVHVGDDTYEVCADCTP